MPGRAGQQCEVIQAGDVYVRCEDYSSHYGTLDTKNDSVPAALTALL
jgi:hypothetical protein